jgi:hypothetical protein
MKQISNAAKKNGLLISKSAEFTTIQKFALPFRGKILVYVPDEKIIRSRLSH